MTDGPGPKEPPFIQRALEAVEAAISPAVEHVEAEASTITQTFAGTIADIVGKAHAIEREAFETTRAAELKAANAITAIEAELSEHVRVLRSRFPSLVSDLRSALSRL